MDTGPREPLVGNNMDKKSLPAQAGFTLIELLVVIAVIGILASVIMVSLNSARAKARDVRRMADLGEIRKAIELYYDDRGYYPASDCGWDCNGYRYSTDPIAWGALAADLAPYISKLSVDPINNISQPWSPGSYSYAYGNVGRATQRVQYDLTAQLETSSPYRCAIANYKFYFDSRNWCNGGGYSDQIYEASLY